MLKKWMSKTSLVVVVCAAMMGLKPANAVTIGEKCGASRACTGTAYVDADGNWQPGCVQTSVSPVIWRKVVGTGNIHDCGTDKANPSNKCCFQHKTCSTCWEYGSSAACKAGVNGTQGVTQYDVDCMVVTEDTCPNGTSLSLSPIHQCG